MTILNNLSNLDQLLDDNSVFRRDIALELIEEDPDQPRQYFDENELYQLAKTIRERGVKTPISIRPNPSKEGHFIINHGARRVRASKLAGKDTIPAVVDSDYQFIDQVVENIQRSNLQPKEISQAIKKLMDQGMKKNEIATKFGVSNAFISQYSGLLKLPDALDQAYDEGKCTDVTLLNELSVLYKKNQDKQDVIESWITDQTDITRSSIKELKSKLDEKNEEVTTEAAGDEYGGSGTTDTTSNEYGDSEAVEAAGDEYGDSGTTDTTSNEYGDSEAVEAAGDEYGGSGTTDTTSNEYGDSEAVEAADHVCKLPILVSGQKLVQINLESKEITWEDHFGREHRVKVDIDFLN